MGGEGGQPGGVLGKEGAMSEDKEEEYFEEEGSY